jgi:hypothetical protein
MKLDGTRVLANNTNSDSDEIKEAKLEADGANEL